MPKFIARLKTRRGKCEGVTDIYRGVLFEREKGSSSPH